ncbi:MAG TPA: TIGR00725 family protein [Streptosporangiaceae bacterium]|nr:TIGR00725 family protein [Streptosporangiaceae bacterium]
MTIQVAVCGPHECGEELRGLAFETGRLLASREAVVVCGGYGGVMAATAEGARSAGGTVVGILSGGDREHAGPHLSIVIPTGLGQARNAVIVNSGDAVIVIGGSWGTLSELAFAMRGGRVPVVQLGGWQIRDAAGRPLPGLWRARTPEEALELTGLW